MKIEKLVSEAPLRTITVTLTYDECRDLANACYEANSNSSQDQDFRDIDAKASFIFDMIKHGQIQSQTTRKYSNLHIID